jgi:hypothetical protein
MLRVAAGISHFSAYLAVDQGHGVARGAYLAVDQGRNNVYSAQAMKRLQRPGSHG